VPLTDQGLGPLPAHTAQEKLLSRQSLATLTPTAHWSDAKIFPPIRSA